MATLERVKIWPVRGPRRADMVQNCAKRLHGRIWKGAREWLTEDQGVRRRYTEMAEIVLDEVERETT